MATNQTKKVSVGKELKKLLRQIEEAYTSLVNKVQRKFQSMWTRIRSMLRENDRAFSMDVIESFTVDTTEKFQEMAAIVGTDLSASLYGLQQELSTLKVAIIQAAAPLAQALLPLLHQAVSALTGFAAAIGHVIKSLFGGAGAADSYTQSTQNALAATQALKRSLAGFDQLQRLQGSDGNFGFSAPDISLSAGWEQFAKDILKFLEPLQKIDLSPAIKAFEKLKTALAPITKTLFEGLNWAWHNIFVPMAQWAAEELLPTFLQMLTDALQALNEVIEALKPAFTWLWDNFLEPIAKWYADKLIEDIQSMAGSFRSFADWITESAPTLNALLGFLENAGITMQGLNDESTQFTGIAKIAAAAMSIFGVAAQEAGPGFAGLLTSLSGMIPAVSSLSGGWGDLGTAAGNAWQTIQNEWSDASGWFSDHVASPMEENARSAANGMIGVFNGMLSGVSSSFNLLATLLNSLKITFPSWLPGLGGKTISFHLPNVTTPEIPQLAQGAVLPANKPFLAVVGDQRHGTNIEAPLSTIQEAVALALEDRLDGVLAGFQAVTERQERILQAIFSLDISEGAVYDANDRYSRKMAVVTGGYV